MERGWRWPGAGPTWAPTAWPGKPLDTPPFCPDFTLKLHTKIKFSQIFTWGIFSANTTTFDWKLHRLHFLLRSKTKWPRWFQNCRLHSWPQWLPAQVCEIPTYVHIFPEKNCWLKSDILLMFVVAKMSGTSMIWLLFLVWRLDWEVGFKSIKARKYSGK